MTAAPRAQHPHGPSDDLERLRLSVVIPVYNERENIGPLLDEVAAVLRPLGRFEAIVVDDASTDGTAEFLATLGERHPELRLVRHLRNRGQSIALATGVDHASAAWVATLDGDGQNDPADLPSLLAERDRAGAQVKLVGGWRQQRRDSWSKRIGSRIANAVRRRLLRDGTPDTGCGIKLFERQAFLGLPRFDHMHRYLPALFNRAGWTTVSVPVGHRHRRTGVSKYSNLQRLKVGLFDLIGVAWLLRRPFQAGEVRVHGQAATAAASEGGVAHGR